jgi:hypothetical protein
VVVGLSDLCFKLFKSTYFLFNGAMAE